MPEASAADCQLCAPHPIPGVDNDLLRQVDLIRICAQDPCCAADHGRVVRQLANGARHARWPGDILSTEVEAVAPDAELIALCALERIRDWHQTHPGDVLAMAATRLVWPSSLLLGPGWAHGGGVRRSDGHVHHGGVFSFDDILRFRRAPKHRNDLPGRRQVALWNALIRVLRRPQEFRQVEVLLRDFLHGTLRHSSDAFNELKRYTRSYRDGLPKELREFVLDASASREARDLVVRCASALYANVKIPLHGGFGEFFRVFEETGPEKTAGSLRYQEVLTRHLRGAGATRLELRKNGGARKVLQQVCETEHPGLEMAAITAPTGLGRNRPSTGRGSGREGAGSRNTARMKVPVVDWSPDVDTWEYFHTFDVNGSETDSLPSWLFAVTFARIRATAKSAGLEDPSFCVHAGESWISPLDGLRRMGEAMMFPSEVRPKRIGHGLALDAVLTTYCHDCWKSCVRDSSVSDLVFNWLWLATLGIVDHEDPPGWSRLAAEPVCDLVGAYAALFTTTLYESKGWLTATTDEVGIEWPDLLGTNQTKLRDILTPAEIEWHSQAGEAAFHEAQNRLVREFAESDVAIECCPTSNVWIGRVKWYDQHPAFRFAEHGIAVTLNTDNPGFFETTVADEEQLILASADVGSAAEVADMIDQARDLGMRLTAEHVAAPVDWSRLGGKLAVASSARTGGKQVVGPHARSQRTAGT